MIKATQTSGFLMHLRVGGCDDKQFREVLKLTESFVLRRHVCRERSNDTETLFARLCGVDPKNPLEATKKAYRELCPTDEKFKAEFAEAAFTSNLIERARYCLERIEASKHGKHDELQVLGATDVHVEHIMPQKIKTKKVKEELGDWVTYLGSNAESQHPKFVDRIGNLTLFAGALNIGASNNPFARKKAAYKESSIILTNELTKRSNFKFRDIEKRSGELSEIAVELWPRP
ncbi:HNH endonuclease family protein [Bradyrhizobium sp. C-145]|uniref:HNH endonuclease family protein n=1 Tax=Bradyrhizobium sp. C-145 TaxID=574727 RepID=UPI00201B929A|nr:HNH endonuclease family protein [Bradyrhizobium sp. C-145]UQR64290.1 HNH endonuclease family protein [Bradyrhizobium sp. C-145]